MSKSLKERIAEFSADSDMDPLTHSVFMALVYDAYEEGSQDGYDSAQEEE